MTGIYSNPERFGLEFVGQVDWSSGMWEFDLTVVWRSTVVDGLWYVGRDSGCSCPSPFENKGLPDLEAFSGQPAPWQILAQIHAENAESIVSLDLDARRRRASQVATLAERIMERVR